MVGSYMAAQMLQQAERDWAAGKVIPDRITSALDAAGLDGPEVDLACGVEEPAVDMWEAGTLYPTWEQLCALADLCHVTPAMFIFEPSLAAGGPVWICGTDDCLQSNRDPVLEFTPEAIAAANLPRRPRPPDGPPPPPTKRRRMRRAA